MSSLLLVALLAIFPTSVRADESSAPSPELIFLEKTLIQKRDDKAKGVVTAEQHQSFLAKFRPELVQTLERLPPSPANVAAYSRILTLLGDHAAAIAGLARALEATPDDTTLSLAIGQAYYEKADYAAALATAEAVLKRDPQNDAARFLKHSSMGRVAPSAETRTRMDADAQTPASRAVRADIVFAAPLKKRAASEIPAISSDEPAPRDSKPLPLWPLLPAAGLGAGVYVVAKSRRTVESEEGFNADDRPQPGEMQRFVAGAILSGLAAAALYLGGGYVLSVGAPLASRFMSGPAQQAMRLAQSEAGAINPRSIAGVSGTPQAKAAAEETTEIARQVVIKKGELLNRVWHSEWTKGSKLSGPEGYSYCRGACLPINASSAVEGRGLNVGVINNARSGALYRVTGDIVVTVRRSIGGYNEEILLRGPDDVKKLKLLSDSVSSIPPGP